MLNFDPQLELRIIKTIVNRRKTDWLSILNVDWFGQPACREIYTRLATLRANGKQIPTGLTLGSDPVLSESSQALLQGDVPAFEDTEHETALDSLDRYRQGRVILSMAQEVSKLLTPNDAKIPPARDIIQKCLASLQSADFQDDFLQYGRESEKTIDLYEAMMAQSANSRFIPTGLRSIDEQQGGMARGRIYAIGANSGGGKCFGINTPILMHDGSVKRVQDISAGDLVMGPDSLPRKVTSLARGHEEMFRLTPVKGEAFEVNRSHVLSLKWNGTKKKGEIINLSVDQYLKSSITLKLATKLYRTGIELPEQPLPVDPYVLGVFIGDGARHNKAITNSAPEVIEALQQYADQRGCCLNTFPSSGSFVHRLTWGRGQPNPIHKIFTSCVVGEEKVIPDIYLRNSRVNRLQLLAGLLDTDGHLHHNYYEIITKFPQVKESILFLARSVGLAATVRDKFARTQKGLLKYYRINIFGSVDQIPCRVPRKKALPRKQVKNVLHTGFSLQSLGDGEYFGFEVEGPDRLFLLGDFTVTHNSTLANQIAINAYRSGFSGVYGSLEMNREECMMRTQSNITRIPHDRFQLQKLSPDERKKSDRALAKFIQWGEKTQKPLEYLCPNRDDISIVDFFAMIEPLSFDYFVVDYLNLMKPVNPKEQLWWNIGEGFRLAKKFAQRTNTVGMMLVQTDEETGDLKYAKSIKHHSDGVWTWKMSQADREAGTPVEIQQTKLRNFKPGKFYLQPEFEYCAFNESFGAGASSAVPAPQPIKPMKLS